MNNCNLKLETWMLLGPKWPATWKSKLHSKLQSLKHSKNAYKSKLHGLKRRKNAYKSKLHATRNAGWNATWKSKLHTEIGPGASKFQVSSCNGGGLLTFGSCQWNRPITRQTATAIQKNFTRAICRLATITTGLRRGHRLDRSSMEHKHIVVKSSRLR